MKIEIGESLFYSWIRHVKGCQIVQTNWKPSLTWVRKNEEQLEFLKEEIGKCFEERGYSIYKKNSSLDQIIKQCESDVFGISFVENCDIEIYAAEVAFHKNGLQYGSEQENIEKVIFKLFRTAICIYGYFDKTEAEIIFASPKIGNKLYDKLLENVTLLQDQTNKLGYNFKFRIIANDDFKNTVLESIIECSDSTEDTNELFMRSYQLVEMFNKKGKSHIEKMQSNVKKNGLSKSTLEEIPVGKIVRNELKNRLETGYVSNEEIEKLLTSEYSQATFKLSYPLLTDVSEPYDKQRYYKASLVINGKEYKLCNHWFDSQKQLLISWLEQHKTVEK